MKHCLWLICLLMLGIVQPATGQSPGSSRHFSEEDGLSSSKVTALLYDQQGYLWVGTDYGLNRFNGIRFRTYLPVKADTVFSAPGNEYITALAETKSGRIWIGTQNGLYFFDYSTLKFKPFPLLSNKGIFSMVVKGELIILTTTDREGFVIDSRKLSSQRFEKFYNYSGLIPKAYKSITAGTESGNIYIETNEGYISPDRNGNMIKVPAQSQTKRLLLKRVGLNYHDVIPTYDQDLLYFDSAAFCLKKMSLPIPPSFIGGFRTVYQVMPRTFLGDMVLTQQGIFLGDLGAQKIWNPEWLQVQNAKLPYGPVYCGIRGKENQVWVGGANGLWLLEAEQKPFKSITIDPSPTTSFDNRYGANLFLEAPGLQLVADVYLGDLLVIRDGKVIKRLPTGSLTGIVHKDRSGVIWVSGGNKLYQFDQKLLKLNPIAINNAVLDPEIKTAFFYMADDGRGYYWFQSNNQGILQYHAPTKQWSIPPKLQNNALKALSSIYYDPANKFLWIGTEKNGLYRYDPANETLVPFEQDATGRKNVYGIVKDGYNRIWAAYYPGGLVAFDGGGPINKVLKTIGTQEGLPSNACTSVLLDQTGDLWAGTSRGLALVIAKDLRVLNWGSNSGLKTTFLDMPLCRWGTHEISAGGKQGIEIWNPESIKKNIPPGKLLLEQILVNDQARLLEYGNTLYLQPGENKFNVIFGTTSFEKPAMNTYQSRLIGLQKEWVDCIEAGKVSWSNLPPGKYKLEIRQLYQSVVQPNGLVFDVVVIPPFYKTYWFYALIGFLVAGFIFGMYWLRIQSIRKEAQLKTAFHQQLAKVEMSALRAQMNPHFVFNSLNAINRFILLNETDIASTYLTKFSRLIRMILDHSRSELVTLEQELNALKLYIELEALRFDNKFSYAIDLEEAVEAGAIEVPPLLIQPFVENAIWHGLMHQKDHGQLKIHIGLSQQLLWITVQDNGIGRAMAASLKSKSAQEHKSHGMQVTHDRLALMQGRFGGKASFEVIDLFAENGSPAGTKVNIKMSLV